LDRRVRPYLLLILVSLLLDACGTLQAGIEPTSGPTLPSATATATFVVSPKDLCQGYLELLVSVEDREEQAVVTSYRCGTAWIDSTGQSPKRSPSLAVGQGSPISLQLAAEEPPASIDLRLYPGAGVAPSFFRWPEELPDQVEPVDKTQPEPSADLVYTASAPPGEYTLTCRATWGEDVDVFYAISFILKDSEK